MRTPKALQKIAPLLKAPSFTSREASRLGVRAATLTYYVRSGQLVRVSHGVYRAAKAPEIEDFRWEDLITAVRSTKDGVVCLTSALAVYGLTEEIPRQHWIGVWSTTRHRSPASVKVVRMRKLNLGRTTIRLSGIEVPIFDRERTVVDAFRYLSRETALKALKMALAKKKAEKVDPEKIRAYARALHTKIEPYLLAVMAA